MCVCVWHGVWGPFNYPVDLDQAWHNFLFCSTPDSEATTVIHDIMDEYVDIKREFVGVCTTQGSPSLDEVKELCIDLIECAFKRIPRVTRQEDDIERAKTMKELARIVCFHLSNWANYEFFKKVVARFQPALKSVKDRLMHYEEKLKPLLLQKLEHIAELQQR